VPKKFLPITLAFYLLIFSISLSNVVVFLDNSQETKIINTLEDELSYWKRVVHTYPSYRDGYLEIARIEYLLGNYYSSRESLETARLKNPNSIKVTNVENVLGESN